jgi:hypothetical protein
MKKALSIALASFYLLLTTGMFVCLVHCGAEYFWGDKAMPMQQMAMGTQKHAKNDDKCGCCKQHGNFVVKENIKPGLSLHFSLPVVAIVPLWAVPSFNNGLPTNELALFMQGKAPPGLSGRQISIQHCSLLI